MCPSCHIYTLYTLEFRTKLKGVTTIAGCYTNYRCRVDTIIDQSTYNNIIYLSIFKKIEEKRPMGEAYSYSYSYYIYIPKYIYIYIKSTWQIPKQKRCLGALGSAKPPRFSTPIEPLGELDHVNTMEKACEGQMHVASQQSTMQGFLPKWFILLMMRRKDLNMFEWLFLRV